MAYPCTYIEGVDLVTGFEVPFPLSSVNVATAAKFVSTTIKICKMALTFSRTVSIGTTAALSYYIFELGLHNIIVAYL